MNRKPGYFAEQSGPDDIDYPVDEIDYPADDSDTEPLLLTRAGHGRAAAAETWRRPPSESWHAFSAPDADDGSRTPAQAQPIGFAHNGFHTDNSDKFQPLPRPSAGEPRANSQTHHVDDFQQLAERIDSLSDSFADFFDDRGSSWSAFEVPEERPSRYSERDDDTFGGLSSGSRHERRPRHYREDPDDGESYGRHSRP